ncbi:hypothetical protein CF326_g7630 [Tilletia indica]|nr:hypothetical protein CF326_g7630 [Tilletia indica]
MWSPRISKHTLGSTLTLIVGLLTVGAQASFIPNKQQSGPTDLLPRYGRGAYQRPGDVCDLVYGVQDNCAVSNCGGLDSCFPDGTCGFHCERIPLGGSGCITNEECKLGLCVAGTCTRLPVGGSCKLDGDCASLLCSVNGICIDAASRSLMKGEVCWEDRQCLSGFCNYEYKPRSLCRKGATIFENPARCDSLPAGQACTSDDQCVGGACSAAGTRQYLPVGAVCRQEQECSTRLCYTKGDAAYCVSSSGGGACNIDADCSTRICTSITGLGRFCKQNNVGGYCRDLRDCLSHSCNTSTNTCRAPVGANCSKNAMCSSGLCEGGKCSKLGRSDACTTPNECISGSSDPPAPPQNPLTCGPAGCIERPYCSASKDGDLCVDDGDCSASSWCSGSIVGAKSGQCKAGARPVSTTTSKATSTSSVSTIRSTTTSTISTSVRSTSTSSTSTKTTSVTSTKSVSTSKASTTSSKSTTITKPATTTTKVSTTTKTTSKSSTTTTKPSAAACTANAVCTSGYCRKALLSDGVTRASTGTCDVKKASGARRYQNGGCLSGTCNKTKRICV